MVEKQLLEQIKKHDRSVSEAAKRFGVKNRQTMYNYIKYFENGELTKIPENVGKYFQKLMAEDPSLAVDHMDFIASLKNRGNRGEIYRAISYAIVLAKEELKEMSASFDELTEHEKFGGKYADPESETAYQNKKSYMQSEIQRLEEYIAELTAEKDELSKPRSYTEYLNFRGEDIDSRLKHMIEQGGYGGPCWDGSIDISTICLADDGEYMVLSDRFVRGYARTTLKLYAIIGGKRVHIATYPFKENESFVKFSLIPKLSYFYEVVDEGFDYEYTSGILELKNSV